MDGGATKNTAALERILKMGFTKPEAVKILKKLIAKKRKMKKGAPFKPATQSKKKKSRKASAFPMASIQDSLRNQIEAATAARNVQQANDLARALSESKIAKEDAEQKQKELQDVAKLSDQLKLEAAGKKREADDAKREAAAKKIEANIAKRDADESKRQAQENMLKSEESRIAAKKLKKGVVKLTNRVADIEFVKDAKEQKIKSKWQSWVLEEMKKGNIPFRGRTNITGEDMPVSTLENLPYKKILDASKKLRIHDIRDVYKQIHQDTVKQFSKPREKKYASPGPRDAGDHKPPTLHLELGSPPNANIEDADLESGVQFHDDGDDGVVHGTGRLMFRSIFGSGRPDILSNHQLDFLMQKHPEYRGTISRDEIHKLDLPANAKSCWIMNTDPADMPGKHWVAVYLDPIDELTIEYYNSSGEPCPDDIFQDIQKAVDKLKLPMKLRFKDNRIQNQDDSNNCGWFCMYFLKQRLAGKTWKFCTGYTELTENLIENWKNNLKIPEKFRDV